MKQIVGTYHGCWWLLIGLWLVSQGRAYANDAAVSFTAIAQQVSSGDQLTVYNPDIGLLPVQLLFVDAPEMALGACKAQPWADIAAKALATKVQNQPLQVQCLSQPLSSGVALCEIFVQGESVNQWMISQGYAWVDRQQGKQIWLNQLEQEAKRKRAGFWADARGLTPPWVQRAQCLGQ